jgi:hypothetical protein
MKGLYELAACPRKTYQCHSIALKTILQRLLIVYVTLIYYKKNVTIHVLDLHNSVKKNIVVGFFVVEYATLHDKITRQFLRLVVGWLRVFLHSSWRHYELMMGA